MEEHCMPLWNFEALSIQQWNPICKPTIGKVVHRAWDKANLCLGRTPTSKWVGRVGQQGPAERTEEKTGKGENKLVRINSKNFVVLSHHPTINNEENVIQFSIWVGCHDTSGSARKFS